MIVSDKIEVIRLTKSASTASASPRVMVSKELLTVGAQRSYRARHTRVCHLLLWIQMYRHSDLNFFKRSAQGCLYRCLASKQGHVLCKCLSLSEAAVLALNLLTFIGRSCWSKWLPSPNQCQPQGQCFLVSIPSLSIFDASFRSTGSATAVPKTVRRPTSMPPQRTSTLLVAGRITVWSRATSS